MKNLYLISFLGGTAGNFILQLLSQLVDGKTVPIGISTNGGAHDSLHLKYNAPQTSAYRNFIGIEPVYKYINHPLADTLPGKDLIMVDHLAPNWDELFTLFPSCKNIIITLPAHMSLRLAGNMFYKTVCGSDRSVVNEPWQVMREGNPDLHEYEYPEDVPFELLEKSFRTFAKDYSLYILPPFNGEVSTDNHKDKICLISYYDIIYDMNKVLNQLKDFTGLELPEGIENVYKQYLDAQAELVKTKMPWVDDK